MHLRETDKMRDDNKDNTPNTSNMGLAITLAVGLGVVLESFFLIT